MHPHSLGRGKKKCWILWFLVTFLLGGALRFCGRGRPAGASGLAGADSI